MNKDFWKLYNLLLKDKLLKSGAVVWLQGDRFDRAENVLKTYKSKLVKYVVISGNNILIGTDIRVGENNISLLEMKDYLLKNGLEDNDIIVDDGAMNTREQAEHILKIAKNEKWSNFILVGSSYYQPRAFLTFLKAAEQIKWEGRIINQPAVIAWNKKPAGRDETVEFIFNQEFKKIKEYKKDLATIKQGIKYLSEKQ